MRWIPDKVEVIFLARFVCQAVSGRSISLPDFYRDVETRTIDDWHDEALEIVIGEGRRQLDSSYTMVESVRRRGQYLIGMATALLGLGALQVGQVVDNALVFLIWSLGMIFAFLALLIAYAIACARAELGSIDTILLSHEIGSDGLSFKRMIAQEYLEQVKASVNTASAWLTVLQDGIRLTIFSVVLVLFSLGLSEVLHR